MYAITKEFHFSASHQLKGLAPCHPCGRLHGHNYVVELELSAAELDEHGFVIDYGELALIREWLDDEFDHKHLNDCLRGNPTAELLARYIFDRWKPGFNQLIAVRVKETAKTSAEYKP